MNLDQLERIISNPFYALPKVAEVFSIDHEIIISEETWIKVAVRAIKEDGDGGENFLKNLLENLKGNFVPDPDDASIIDGYKNI